MAFRSKVPLYQLPVFKILVVQAVATVCLALVFLLGKSLNAGFCALLGGLIALLPNTYFTIKAFRYSGARSAVAVILSIWTGEVGKYVLTAALFAVVFLAIKPLDVIALFSSYLMVLIASSLGLLLVKKVLKI